MEFKWFPFCQWCLPKKPFTAGNILHPWLPISSFHPMNFKRGPRGRKVDSLEMDRLSVEAHFSPMVNNFERYVKLLLAWFSVIPTLLATK